MSNDVRSDDVDVAVALIVRDGKVLLGRRSPGRKLYADAWDLFGGHVEAGETIAAALARELREELDITPTETEFLETMEEPDPAQNGHRVYHIYLVGTWTGRGPRLLGDEHSELRWCSLKDALALDLALPEYERLLRRHVGGPN